MTDELKDAITWFWTKVLAKIIIGLIIGYVSIVLITHALTLLVAALIRLNFIGWAVVITALLIIIILLDRYSNLILLQEFFEKIKKLNRKIK